MPKVLVVYGFACPTNIELGPGPIKPKNGFLVRTGICITICVMSHHWNSTKKGIEKWLDRKIHEFAAQENKNPCLSKEEWLNRYLYMKIHEIFFYTFPIELYEWLAKLKDIQGRWKLDNMIVWTPELVRWLEASENRIAWVFEHWLDRIIGGFVTEFVVDTSVSYNEVERPFFKGPWGKYLKSLNNWIKMLLCQKWVMQLPWCLEPRKAEILTGMKG